MLERTNEVFDHPILRIMKKFENHDIVKFYTATLCGESYSLYEYLHKLFLCAHMVLIFKHKREEVSEFVNLLKEFEGILIQYADLLFSMELKLMLQWTMFVNHECHVDEMHDRFKYYSYSGIDGRTYFSERKKHIVGKDEEFIYEMHLYLQFVFSESFFQNQMELCSGNRLRNPSLLLILGNPPLLKYAFSEDHPWISEHMFWIIETNPGILFTQEFYLYIYANRKNEECMIKLYHIYRVLNPIHWIFVITAVLGEYGTHGDAYRLSTEEGLALTIDDLHWFLHQSDINYPEEDIGRELTKKLCKSIRVGNWSFHRKYSPLNHFWLTKKLKKIARVHKISVFFSEYAFFSVQKNV
jgi:hypothetical protein